MIIELSYIFISLLLVTYAAWLYFKRKERTMIYLGLGFTFLAISTLLQILTSKWWIYIMTIGTPLRLLELTGLAFFVCFAITTIIALGKTLKN